MNRFWDSDGEDSDREVLQVNVTSDEMDLDAGRKSEATGGKDELSLAERLVRREKKKVEKKKRAQKRIEAMEELAKEDDSTSTNTVEEEIVSKKRRMKRKKLSWDLPELKLMRVDEVEEKKEELTDEAEFKMEVEETGDKVVDKEDVEKEECKDEDDKVVKEEAESKTRNEEECDRDEKMEEDAEMAEIWTRKEARKEANRWRKVLDGMRDMLDEFEDSGMARTKVRKCRRDLEGVKGGLSRLAESGVWPERREEKEAEKIVRMKEEKLATIKAEKGDEKEVGSSTKIRRELMPIIVDQWVGRWSELGREDIKIQVFDCEEGWMERDVRGGLWESVFRKERYEEDEMKKLKVEWKRREREKMVTYVYALPFGMLVTLMMKDDKRIVVKGKEKGYDLYVDVRVCWRCQRYGHTKEGCEEELRCRGCGGRHAVRDCVRKLQHCVTCEEEGLEARGHRANSIQCVLHRALLHKKREKMEELIRYQREGRYSARVGLGRGRRAEYERVAGKPGKY